MRKDKVQVGRLGFADRAGRPAGQAASRLEQSRPSTGAGAFTPGRWSAVEALSRAHMSAVVASDGMEVALVGASETDEQNANAHLIAAAPELFEALAVSTAFLELEAQGHRSRGDTGKAEACEGQAKSNRALLSKALGHPSGDSR